MIWNSSPGPTPPLRLGFDLTHVHLGILVPCQHTPLLRDNIISIFLGKQKSKNYPIQALSYLLLSYLPHLPNPPPPSTQRTQTWKFLEGQLFQDQVGLRCMYVPARLCLSVSARKSEGGQEERERGHRCTELPPPRPGDARAGQMFESEASSQVCSTALCQKTGGDKGSGARQRSMSLPSLPLARVPPGNLFGRLGWGLAFM